MLVYPLEFLETSATFYVFHSQMPFTPENALVPRSVCSSVYLPSLLPQLPPPVALET